MASSGMLRRVAVVRTEVSEELSASLIRVTRLYEEGTTLAVTSNRHKLRRNCTGFKDTVTVPYISVQSLSVKESLLFQIPAVPAPNKTSVVTWMLTAFILSYIKL
jgi:hypothetical protein